MVLPILIMAAVSLAEVTSPASVSSFNNGGLPPMAAGMIKSPTGQPHAPMKGAVEVCTKLIGDDDNEDARQDQNNPTVAPPPPSPINNYTLAGRDASSAAYSHCETGCSNCCGFSCDAIFDLLMRLLASVHRFPAAAWESIAAMLLLHPLRTLEYYRRCYHPFI